MAKILASWRARCRLLFKPLQHQGPQALFLLGFEKAELTHSAHAQLIGTALPLVHWGAGVNQVQQT